VLPAENRLRRRQEFTTTVRAGRRAARPLLVVHLGPVALVPDQGAAAAAPRVGFVVGRTVGSAVQRNRVKRRLRHLLRDRMASLPPGARVVVRALPGAAAAGSAQLAADLDGALQRLQPRRELS
jgi:ribonuclease P protein component